MKNTKFALTSAALAAIFLGSLTTASSADSSPDRIGRLEATILDLERRISVLEASSIQSQSEPFRPKATGDWKKKSNWRLLSKGMSKDQARELLGEPDKIDARGSFEHWRWKVPYGPSVTFYDEQIYGWDEQ